MKKKQLKNIMIALLIIAPFTIVLLVGSRTIELKEKQTENVSDNYWYQGKAEITSYELEQARYGQVHDGHAVLIFVTEDFSREKQVKLDNPSAAGDDAVKVMKLNFTKKFLTGIYPYSTMSSVFTPLEGSQANRSLKVTTSSQEWCGHIYTQLNKRNDKLDVKGYSYFESEGDFVKEVEDVLMEDEIWNLIRLEPGNLPVGKMKIIPGTLNSRLLHQDIKPTEAELKMEKTGNKLMQYSIHYPLLNRSLAIHFINQFPYQITGWEETIVSGHGTNAQKLTTRASRKKTEMVDYWNKNSVEDLKWRQKLGL